MPGASATALPTATGMANGSQREAVLDGAASDWLGSVLAGYTWSVAAATALAAGRLALAGPPGAAAATVAMLALVAVVGLPHGAYDLEVARRLLAPRVGRGWAMLFCTAYLLLAAIALALWLAAPVAGLVVLLVGGALHWGDDDLEIRARGRLQHWLLAASRGAIPVGLPMLFHPEAAAAIFAALIGQPEVGAELVQAAGLVAVVLALPGIAAALAIGLRTARSCGIRMAAEIVTLVAWFAIAEPLLAFAVYFCLWHAVRHALRSMATIDPASPTRAAGRYLARVAGPTVATWLLAGVLWFLLLDAAIDVTAAWRVVFIGLFALTVPHVLLDVVVRFARPTPRNALQSVSDT